MDSLSTQYRTDESPDTEKLVVKPHVEPTRSAGERIFDYLTYGGVGFGLNLGLSVLITDYFTHGKGDRLLHSLSKKSAQKLHEMTGASATKIENNTFSFLKTNLLMSGGHVVMIPIKLMEDSKRHMVHRINRFLGVDQAILRDGKETPIGSLAEEELPLLSEEQPKQTWLRTVARRLLGLSATLTVGTLMGSKLQHKVEDTITDGMILPAMRNTPIGGIQQLAENDRFQRYARLVSLDQFFTVITSGIAYVTNGSKKHHDDDVAPEAIARVASVSLTESTNPEQENKSTNITTPHSLSKKAAGMNQFPTPTVSTPVISGENPSISLGMQA